MSEDSLPGLDPAWAALADQGYALTDEQETGLTGLRQDFLKKYFNDNVLHLDPRSLPADRKRARDVVKYQWHDGHLKLWEYDTTTITDRGGVDGKREYDRVWLLDDPQAEKMIRTFLSLVPPHRRQAEGTFGVNLFRTFTDVVTKLHHDDEEFIVLYVLDRIGGGAESHLYRSADVSRNGEPTGEPVLRYQLNPGQILIFEDMSFKHGATPLKPLPDGTAQRDVLVCTVDYETTYLKSRTIIS